MKPPKGHEYYNKRYWKLKRAIYGLKQSGKQWNNEFHKYLTKIHYKRIINEPCLYIKENKNNKIIGLLAVYVDDILNELSTNLTNIEINVDNKAAIYNAKNHSINPKTKQMDIRVQYNRELINNRKINLRYIKSI